MTLTLGQACAPGSVLPGGGMCSTPPAPGPVSTAVLAQVATDTAFWSNLLASLTSANTPAQAQTMVSALQAEITTGASSDVVADVLSKCPNAGVTAQTFEAALTATLANEGCPAVASSNTSAFPWALVLIGAGVLILVMVEY
jgi:hypothetical protein